MHELSNTHQNYPAMKKAILIVALILAISPGYGQKFTAAPRQGLYSAEQKKLTFPVARNLKGGGDIIFKETFNWKDPGDPKGFSYPPGWQFKDVNNMGHNWVWRAGTDSISGRYTHLPGHIYSKSPEDGYLVLPMDEYNFNDGIVTMNDGDVWFQLPPLDFSTRPGVYLSLSQYFRCNTDQPDIKCLLSVDGGVRWAIVDLSFKTGVHVFCKKPYPEVNISEIVAGMSNVLIRFTWKGCSHYFWCIDDLELSEAFQYELRLEESWLSMTDLTVEDKDKGYYYMVPFSQTGVNHFGEYSFKGLIFNGGMADLEGCGLNVKVLRNGVPVYDQTSAKRDLWAFESDTFAVEAPFVPDGYGDYKMILTATPDQADGVPSNNVNSDIFHVTDSIYSISDWEWESQVSPSIMLGLDHYEGGDYIGLIYDISKPCEVASISCAIMQRKDVPMNSTQPGHEFMYHLFKWHEEESDWGKLISSDYMTVTPEMINTWVTLPLIKDGESEFLEPGQYLAAIEPFHGSAIKPDSSMIPFTIGLDQSHSSPAHKDAFKFPGLEGWFSFQYVPMIRLNLAETGAPAAADVVFNVDMTLPVANGYFNPAGNDFVDVAGTFNDWKGSARMIDDDGDGTYTLTVTGLPTFQPIEYKYRINGDWNTSELPSDGQNRMYRTSYYNRLHDVYNNGISMGTVLSPTVFSVHVFPNPARNAFNLEITYPLPTDLTITLTSLQGQVVYRKLVTSAMNYSEPIDIKNFASGMYILKVNDKAIKLMIDD